eukprot:3054502-Rhodomonas_salina.2
MRLTWVTACRWQKTATLSNMQLQKRPIYVAPSGNQRFTVLTHSRLCVVFVDPCSTRPSKRTSLLLTSSPSSATKSCSQASGQPSRRHVRCARTSGASQASCQIVWASCPPPVHSTLQTQMRVDGPPPAPPSLPVSMEARPLLVTRCIHGSEHALRQSCALVSGAYGEGDSNRTARFADFTNYGWAPDLRGSSECGGMSEDHTWNRGSTGDALRQERGRPASFSLDGG